MLNKSMSPKLFLMLATAFAIGFYIGAPGGKDVPVIEEVQHAVTYEVEQPASYVEREDPALGIALRRAKEFEGFSHTPYLLYGQWHIGYGHSISSPEYYPHVTREAAEELLISDMKTVERELVGSLSFYRDLPLAARMVLLDMGYNMGVPRLLGFTYMLYAMQEGNWEDAAHEMIDSLYYEQVTRRASNNVMLILDLVGTTTRGSVVL